MQARIDRLTQARLDQEHGNLRKSNEKGVKRTSEYSTKIAFCQRKNRANALFLTVSRVLHFVFYNFILITIPFFCEVLSHIA